VADRTPPTLTLTLSEDSAYAHATGDTLYYSDASGAFTVTATAGDGLAGLSAVTFPDTVSEGMAYDQGGALQAAVAHLYRFGVDGSRPYPVVCRRDAPVWVRFLSGKMA